MPASPPFLCCSARISPPGSCSERNAALRTRSCSICTKAREISVQRSHIVALSAAKREEKHSQRRERRVGSSGTRSCSLPRATGRRHTSARQTNINLILLLYKHSNTPNSDLVTISANEIMSEQRRKQKRAAALLEKRERDPFKPISPVKKKSCLKKQIKTSLVSLQRELMGMAFSIMRVREGP